MLSPSSYPQIGHPAPEIKLVWSTSLFLCLVNSLFTDRYEFHAIYFQNQSGFATMR